MVSFQCEGCGDVLKKPKLDAHRNHCRGASYSCLDCMTHFHGTEYRSHTSCVTEDQKYQGALYRDKNQKAGKRKSVSIIEPNEDTALVPRPAYFEDVPDQDAPPRAPSPPPAVPANVNVFDYLVTEESPRSSRTSVNAGKRSSTSTANGKSYSEGKENLHKSYRASDESIHSREYEEQGFSYGTAPVNPRPYLEANNSDLSLHFMTPAAKETRAKLERKERPPPLSHTRSDSGSTKRKRANTDEHANGALLEYDTPMPDVSQDRSRLEDETPMALVHSGLTGGLSRLTSNETDFPFPPIARQDKGMGRERDHRSRPSTRRDDPASPLKRSRRTKEDNPNGPGISIKGRAGKVMSLVGAAFVNPAAAHNEGPNRRRNSSSDQGRSQTRDNHKRHRVHRYNGTSSDNVRFERSDRSSRHRTGGHESPESQRKQLKAIEYHRSSADNSDSDSEADRRRGTNGEMVIFGAAQQNRARCESFMSFVTKGPESERGCSINKALKRWHRDIGDSRSSHSGRVEEEKELWRSLRLKRNERGEIVVFF